MDAAPTATLGERYTVAVSGLDFTSLGAPANTRLKVAVGGRVVARNVPVADGAATASFTLPNRGRVVITAYPSRTVVRVPVTVTKGTVTVIDKDESRTVRQGRPVSFRVRTAALGERLWPTGRIKVYIGDRVVARTTLHSWNRGTKKITLSKQDLRRYGTGTVVVTTKLVSSRNALPAELKVLTLTIT